MHRLLAAAVIGVVTAAASTGPLLVAPPATAAAVTTTDGCLTSIPDPGTTAPVQICYTLFRPAGATQAAPVPMVLHSHGWGGSRTKDPGSFSYLTDAGFGVLSFDQRPPRTHAAAAVDDSQERTAGRRTRQLRVGQCRLLGQDGVGPRQRDVLVPRRGQLVEPAHVGLEARRGTVDRHRRGHDDVRPVAGVRGRRGCLLQRWRDVGLRHR
jgi:pyruvate/2-oxoglutarate dehydrogenase complex dihydrolipoamide acyltransferase (E2) component